MDVYRLDEVSTREKAPMIIDVSPREFPRISFGEHSMQTSQIFGDGSIIDAFCATTGETRGVATQRLANLLVTMSESLRSIGITHDRDPRIGADVRVVLSRLSTLEVLLFVPDEKMGLLLDSAE